MIVYTQNMYLKFYISPAKGHPNKMGKYWQHRRYLRLEQVQLIGVGLGPFIHKQINVTSSAINGSNGCESHIPTHENELVTSVEKNSYLTYVLHYQVMDHATLREKILRIEYYIQHIMSVCVNNVFIVFLEGTRSPVIQANQCIHSIYYKALLKLAGKRKSCAHCIRTSHTLKLPVFCPK